MNALSDWITNLFATWTGVVQVGSVFLAIVAIVFIAIAAKLKIGQIVVTGIAAALVVALVWGGMEAVADRMNTEINASADVTVHLAVDAAGVWALPENVELAA